MVSAKKSGTMLMVLLLFLGIVLPLQHSYAEAHINRVIFPGVSNYLIAGVEYELDVQSDEAGTTSVNNVRYEYSTNNGATWIDLRDFIHSMSFVNQTVWVTLPIDPQLVSAQFRVSAYFSPLIGSNSFSEKVIGPYKILQPGSPSDIAITSNDNGTVTLAWNDNSNMESYYQITRVGADGTKFYNIPNTMDHVGPLSYVDKDMDPYTSNFYVYTISAVVDSYQLDETNKPEAVSRIVKSKARLKIIDDKTSKIDSIITKDLDTVKPIKKDTILLKDQAIFMDKYSKLIGDVDKVAVQNVALNKKALALEVAKSETLTATITPANAVNKKVIWSSDNPAVAIVDSMGKVTAVAGGSAKIKALTEDGGLSSVCVVSVSAKPENITPVTVTPAPATPAPATPAPTKPPVIFSDVGGNWASKEIAKAVELGIVNGYPDGSFRPDEGVTRAEFTSMLVHGMKTMAEGDPLTFKDTGKIGAWAVQAVSQAVKLKIISGYSDGTFRPNASITHAEMVSMVMRASGIPADNIMKTGFADDADIPKWAKNAVSLAETAGIITVSTRTENKFLPQAVSTRAEAASAIVRMLMRGTAY